MAAARPMSETPDQWIDPALHALAAEQREMNRKVIDAGADNPPPGAVPPEKIRRARREGRGGFPGVVLDDNALDVTIEADPPVRVRHHPNADASALLVHVHGGGWVFGSPDEVDAVVAELARAASCDAISVDYRLAPEHPFPAGRNDVMVAIEWALDEAARRGTDRVIVAGESSGAHLALCAVLELGPAALRARGLVGLSLAFGFFDVGLSPSARNWGDEFLALSTPWLQWFADQLVPDVPLDERGDPVYSPINAPNDLVAALPPTFMIVGDADPLLDDTLTMAQRMRDAGASVELAVYPDSPHGFIGMPTAMGRHGWQTITNWIAAAASS